MLISSHNPKIIKKTAFLASIYQKSCMFILQIKIYTSNLKNVVEGLIIKINIAIAISLFQTIVEHKR